MWLAFSFILELFHQFKQLPVILLLLSAFACWILTFPTTWILRHYQILDCPNKRSSHITPTVRGSGICMVMIVAGQLLTPHFVSRVPLNTLFWGLFGLSAISFWDDMRPLHAGWRLIAQSVAAICSLYWLESIARIFCIGSNPAFQVIAAIGFFLWIVGYTNAFNFMDGINGLAAVQAIISGVGSAMIAHHAGLPWNHPAISLALVVAGAALGFLPHNFPRPKAFMGDVASASLGFILATLIIWMAAETNWYVFGFLLLLHTNFLLDTGITLTRRFYQRASLHKPHREHFYQRLVRAGIGHAKITLGEGFLQIIGLALIINNSHFNSVWNLGWTSAAIILIWLGYFCYAEWRFSCSCNHTIDNDKV